MPATSPSECSEAAWSSRPVDRTTSASHAHDSANKGLVLAPANGSEGLYDFSGGHLVTDREAVAANSIATFKQIGGSNTTNVATIGAGAASDGTYKLEDGSWNFRRGAKKSSPGLIIANAGTGALAIGDTKTRPAAYSEVGTDSAVSAVVRQDAGGDGRIYGWGNVDLHGALQQNGKVIADGYGQSRDLDLSSFAAVYNKIDNTPGGDNGFFSPVGDACSCLPAISPAEPPPSPGAKTKATIISI